MNVVRAWPQPTVKKHVRSFLGLTSYYRPFIHDFASIVAPLHFLTRDDVEFMWDEACAGALRALKDALTCAPILSYSDFFKPLTDELLQGWAGGNTGANRFMEGEGHLLCKSHYQGEGGRAGVYYGGVVCHVVGNLAL